LSRRGFGDDAIYFDHSGECRDARHHKGCPGRWRGAVSLGYGPDGKRIRRKVGGRKRSQVAVIDQGGEVLLNRNVPNGVEPILKVIGGLPPGTPAALEAAFGTGWLVELLQDYGFDPHLVHPLRCKAIASARLKKPLIPGT
jgi:hypothetical protein